MNKSRIPFTLVMALGLCAAHLTAQDDPAAKRQKPPVVSESELTLLHYRPQTSSAEQLTELAFSMWGRDFVTETNSKNIRRNIFHNVDSIIIYDAVQRADRILRMIKELDGAQQRRKNTPMRTKLIKLEYATIEEARAVLRPLMRQIPHPTTGRGMHTSVNLEFVPTRSAVIVRDDEEHTKEILNVLAQIDTPRPQVMLSCWIIRGSKESGDSPLKLPPELVDNLKKLVPMPNFHALGMGLVNTSVTPMEQIKMKVNLGDSGRAEISMMTRAFDRGSNVMHVKHCSCQIHLITRRKMGQVPRQPYPQSISTQLSLRDGEFTVLGALGSTPVFVVLKMTKRGKPN